MPHILEDETGARVAAGGGSPANGLAPGLPSHVGLIMDGNGRWAAARGLPRIEGHRRGLEALRGAVRTAIEFKLSYLTVYSFSAENWSRPFDEIQDLMGLLKRFIRKDLLELHKVGVRVRIIGCRDNLQPDIRGLLEEAEAMTRLNPGVTLVVAFNYGGRQEIAAAVREIARKLAAGQIKRVPTSTSGCCRVISTPPTSRTPTSSSARPASSGCPTSCSGRRPTASSCSCRCCGRTSTAPPLPPPSSNMPRATVASAACRRRASRGQGRDAQAFSMTGSLEGPRDPRPWSEPQRRWSDLGTRALSAVVMVVLALTTTHYGGTPFSAVLARRDAGDRMGMAAPRRRHASARALRRRRRDPGRGRRDARPA